jgi:hypothetical protein
MRYLILAASLAAAASGVWAARSSASPPPARQRPEAFEAVMRCRAIAGEAERLRCFDAAAAAMDRAVENRDLVVVDRQQMRETRRRLFGIEVPRLNLFGGGEDRKDEVSELDGIVRSAVENGNGRWVVVLEDGGIWVQVDDNVIAIGPRAGNKVVVRRGALGSYMMRVNGQPGVRVRRQL